MGRGEDRILFCQASIFQNCHLQRCLRFYLFLAPALRKNRIIKMIKEEKIIYLENKKNNFKMKNIRIVQGKRTENVLRWGDEGKEGRK